MMVADFRKRFWVSVIMTVPILLLSPLIQRSLGLQGKINFNGDSYVLFALSSTVFFYGGWPFLNGIVNELKERQPGMMALIAVAISAIIVAINARFLRVQK
jgi:Cu2+-exporting ATPase